MSIMLKLRESESKMSAMGAKLLGAAVAYNVKVDVPREAMRAAIVGAGFGRVKIPDVPLPSALNKATAQLKPRKPLSLAWFAAPNADTPAALGIYVTDPNGSGEAGDPQFCGARVRISNGSAVALPPEGGEANPLALEYAKRLAARTNKIHTYVETSDVTNALAEVLSGMKAAKFCEHGRGHFILSGFVEQWSSLCDALAPYGVSGRMVSMWDSMSDHVSEAKESAKSTFAEDLADLRVKLAKAAAGEGTRSDAMSRRLDECRDLINKAELYRSVLAETADAITGDVTKIRKMFSDILSGKSVTFTLDDAAQPSSFELPEVEADAIEVAADAGDEPFELPAAE
jgi:hypothetical protein